MIKKYKVVRLGLSCPAHIGQVFITDDVSPAVIEKVLGEMI